MKEPISLALDQAYFTRDGKIVTIVDVIDASLQPTHRFVGSNGIYYPANGKLKAIEESEVDLVERILPR